MNQLQSVFKSMPLKEKWIVGQNVRQIYQWIRELALQGVPAMNYRVFSYNMLAEEWNQRQSQQGQYAQKDERLLAIAAIFDRLKPTLQYYGEVRTDIHWIEALMASFDELRLLGITAENFPMDAFENVKKASDLRQMLVVYEAWLDKEKRWDAARTYQLALDAKEQQGTTGAQIVIIDDGFQLMPMVQAFQNFWVTHGGAKIVKIEKAIPVDRKPQLLKAYGDSTEIHQIFEEIKEKGFAFDEVQVIATKPEQLTRIGMIAKTEGIPYSATLGEAIFTLPEARKWIFSTLDGIEETDFWQSMPKTTELEDEVREGIDALLHRYQGYASQYGDSRFLREIFHQSLIRIRLRGGTRTPGAIYVTDLAGADTLQRKATFVLGLDHLEGQDGMTDGPILYDRERERMAVSSITIKQRKREIAEKRKQDLARLSGIVYYSYSCYDAVNFTEKFPSPTILNHYTTEECEAAPMAKYRIPLSKAINSWEWELASFSFPLDLQERYPALAMGRTARELRKSSDLNAYNGKIEWGSEPNLDHMPSSVTKFEKLARSPYLYFIENVLEIGREPEPDEPTVWLNALEKGTLLHEIFQAYYEKILPKGERPNRSRDEKALIAYADELIERLAKGNPPHLAVAREVFQEEVEQTCGIFLSMEELSLGGDTPIAQEVEIKGEIELPNGNGVSLHGKVDRIDQTPEGQYRIYDYKTGKSKQYNLNQYFVKGTRLQHAVYALLYEQENQGTRVDSAGYLFPTRKGNGKRIVYPEQGVENRKDVVQILSLLQEIYCQGFFVPGVMLYANQERVYPELAEQNPGKNELKEIVEAIIPMAEVSAYE